MRTLAAGSFDEFDARPIILAFATNLHAHQIEHEVLTGGFDGGSFAQVDALTGFEVLGEWCFQGGLAIKLDQVLENVLGLTTETRFDDFCGAGERNAGNDDG